MNISRYANIDKFVNVRYIFLLAVGHTADYFSQPKCGNYQHRARGFVNPCICNILSELWLRTPSNMATVVTINRKLVKKFIKKLFQNPVKSQMQLNHMERMHMWSSFKILIEDLRLSSNVAITVTKNRKLFIYCQKTYFKIR